MQPRILIIVPAYNEEKSIASLLLGLRRAAPGIERVVVNDGSSDNTGDVVARLGEKQLRLPCNLGYGLALQTGLQYALASGYDVVVTIDADGQHRPEDVPALLQAMVDEQADMVIGSRFCATGRYSGPLGRRFGQMVFSRLTRLLLGQRIYDTTSGFKAISATACAAIISSAFMDFHTETLVRLRMLDYRIAEVPVTVYERAYGQSMHSLTSAVRYPLKTVILTMVAAMDVLLTRRTR
jgi:glycosyltransferase involved in cell wall biosynthesis